VEARRRADLLGQFFHPMGPGVALVLPENLPGAVPPVGDYYQQLLAEQVADG
jgi:hypothetical protein